MSRARSGGADLHTHTTASDGTCTPEELVTQARKAGLLALAITDHDAVSGIGPAQAAAKTAGLEVAPGVEFGTPSRGGVEEAHIVGLFIDPDYGPLLKAISAFRENRRRRAEKIVERLNQIGIPLRASRVFELAGEGNVGRLHIARALVEAGRAADIQDAFRQWIRAGRPAYVPRERPPAAETIALIHRAGGVAVMAHPGQTQLDEEIPALVEAGLDGIEVFYAEHTPAQERHYAEIARKHGLLVSGGSDFHGGNKDRNNLGCVRLSMERVEELRRRARR